jgi:hypothetical protein
MTRDELPKDCATDEMINRYAEDDCPCEIHCFIRRIRHEVSRRREAEAHRDELRKTIDDMLAGCVVENRKDHNARKERIAKLEAALRFYAVEKRFTTNIQPGGDDDFVVLGESLWEVYSGKRARAALEHEREG